MSPASAAHTPGPWAVEHGDDGDPSVVFTSVPNDDRYSHVNIATVPMPVYDNDEDGHPLVWGDRNANARLIAAAPQMEKLLAQAVKVLDADGIVYGDTGDDTEPLDVLREIRAVLAEIGGADV